MATNTESTDIIFVCTARQPNKMCEMYFRIPQHGIHLFGAQHGKHLFSYHHFVVYIQWHVAGGMVPCGYWEDLTGQFYGSVYTSAFIVYIRNSLTPFTPPNAFTYHAIIPTKMILSALVPLLSIRLWPLLLTWFNFNPSMYK